MAREISIEVEFKFVARDIALVNCATYQVGLAWSQRLGLGFGDYFVGRLEPKVTCHQ